MQNKNVITAIKASEVLDSRGNPTIEVCVDSAGESACAIVPSGASTGVHEALELRDGDIKRYSGLGVMKAVANVNSKIANHLIGFDITNQVGIDKLLCEIDSTKEKSKLGANAILGVSMACAKLGAKVSNLPLYKYLGGANAKRLPVPMMNILNGGAHASNSVDVQEFMIMPVGGTNLHESVRMCAEVYKSLKGVLSENGYSTSVGDEGGFAPNVSCNEEAIEYIIKAIEKSGYDTENDFKLAIDAASSEWYSEDGMYRLPKSHKEYTPSQLIDYWKNLCEKYPVVSIEDGLNEDDFEAWKELTYKLGYDVLLVGDDLFVTNTQRLKKGIKEKIANSILIKPNQIGTITETIDAISMAQNSGYKSIISHRSGESEDTTIADIAVAVNSGLIKCGAPCRSERTAKYNRLFKIEKELCDSAQYYF